MEVITLKAETLFVPVMGSGRLKAYDKILHRIFWLKVR